MSKGPIIMDEVTIVGKGTIEDLLKAGGDANCGERRAAHRHARLIIVFRKM